MLVQGAVYDRWKAKDRGPDAAVAEGDDRVLRVDAIAAVDDVVLRAGAIETEPGEHRRSRCSDQSLAGADERLGERLDRG